MRRIILLAVFIICYVISFYFIPRVEKNLEYSWIVYAANTIMLYSFAVAMNYTQDKPKIKANRYYRLEKTITHKDGHTIVLSYDDKVETYQCKSMRPPALADITEGEEYFISIKDKTMYFLLPMS